MQCGNIQNIIKSKGFSRGELKGNFPFTSNSSSSRVTHIDAFSICDLYEVLEHLLVGTKVPGSSSIEHPVASVGNQIPFNHHSSNDIICFNNVSLRSYLGSLLLRSLAFEALIGLMSWFFTNIA
ncbi:hypothetical protein LIER_36438 [Lithospermum erythrorhizon]|uniref:Uncharacterized protein n=1 Tax=Lithospermum erythrorhizon TaxID=34254 RepID=A0AAV3P5Z9_LITER